MKNVQICDSCGKEFIPSRGTIWNHKNYNYEHWFCSSGCSSKVPKRKGYVAVEFFWEHTVKFNGCWIFDTNRNIDGYCGLQVDGAWTGAHVYSWKLHNPRKNIPKGWVVRHTCDNPPCVNPEHLILGTKSDNIKDYIERVGPINIVPLAGRKHAFADKSMTKERAQEIIDLAKEGIPLRKIAAKFEIGFGTVQRITSGDHWILHGR